MSLHINKKKNIKIYIIIVLHYFVIIKYYY